MSEPRSSSPRSTWLAAVVIALALAAGWYGARSKPEATASKSSAATPKPSAPSTQNVVKRYQVPVTRSQPSQGATDALVTVVEWCDFRVAACKVAETELEALIAGYGSDRVRWVYRHFAEPTPASQLSHEFARVAHEQAGKFWQAKQLLQDAPAAPTPDDFRRYAEQLGLDWAATNKALDRHTHTGHVAADRKFAEIFEVQAVPAFFVNGRRLSGAPTTAALKALLDDELARATALVASGVPKQQVYAELTKNGEWKRGPARPN